MVIPIDRAGITLEDDWDGLRQRFTGSRTGHFKDVAVHADEVLRMQLDFEDAGGKKQIPT